MLESGSQTQKRSSHSGPEASLCSSGFSMKLEAVTPFLGKYRPFVGRCCQTCTPKSWESFFHRSLMDLGFCNVILVKEENTRFRGWLVRRLCCFLWSLEQHIPPCLDASQKIMESTGVQSLLSRRAPGRAGKGQQPAMVQREVRRILGQVWAPPRTFLLRLFSWALLRLLNCLFLNVQLHRGQMKMVHKAAEAGSPLILLSTHKSLLDGLLLPFVLFSQGLGVLRVAWDPRSCSPALRALLRNLGGLFLPAEANLSLDSSEGVIARTVVHAAVEQLLGSGQPLLIFLEEAPGAPGPRLSALGQAWLGLVVQAVQAGIVPDVTLVPVAVTYDLVPDASYDMHHASAPLGLWTGALAVLRRLYSCWGCGHKVCVRVHLAQPFSLQEYTTNARSCWGDKQTLEHLLQPVVLGQCTTVPDTEKEQEWTPVTGLLLALREEDQLLVRRLSCHVLNASVASSAVMSTAIMATLLLCKHRKGVALSRLLVEFSWLTEETLLRGFDVGFSGQLRSLVQHTLSLLRARVVLLRVQQGDLLVVPRPGPGLVHLAHLSAELLPVFLSEAVGACAVRALLAGRVPPEGPWELQGVELLSQRELYHQVLLLLHLLPRDLLLLKPCQSSYCYCQEVLDRLIQCGLLVAEEVGRAVAPGPSTRCYPIRSGDREAWLHHTRPLTMAFSHDGTGHAFLEGSCQLPARISCPQSCGPCGWVLASCHPACGPAYAVAWSCSGILLGSPDLLSWFYLHASGLGAKGWIPACLPRTNGSYGPQTPSSWPACDTGRQRLSAKLLWKLSGDFSDSDSDDFEEAQGQCFRLSEQSRCPDFFIFLCHLLRPPLKAFAQAAAFLHQARLPDTESGYVEQLLEFLQTTAQEEGLFEYADPSLAISAVWTFRDLGVLQQTPSPAGPQLTLSPAFASQDSQDRLEQFIRQFV